MTWLLLVLVLVAAGALYTMGRRRQRHESGVTSFQRHIGALSPEARSESFDRVRQQLRDQERDD